MGQLIWNACHRVCLLVLTAMLFQHYHIIRQAMILQAAEDGHADRAWDSAEEGCQVLATLYCVVSVVICLTATLYKSSKVDATCVFVDVGMYLAGTCESLLIFLPMVGHMSTDCMYICSACLALPIALDFVCFARAIDVLVYGSTS